MLEFEKFNTVEKFSDGTFIDTPPDIENITDKFIPISSNIIPKEIVYTFKSLFIEEVNKSIPYLKILDSVLGGWSLLLMDQFSTRIIFVGETLIINEDGSWKIEHTKLNPFEIVREKTEFKITIEYDPKKLINTVND